MGAGLGGKTHATACISPRALGPGGTPCPRKWTWGAFVQRAHGVQCFTFTPMARFFPCRFCTSVLAAGSTTLAVSEQRLKHQPSQLSGVLRGVKPTRVAVGALSTWLARFDGLFNHRYSMADTSLSEFMRSSKNSELRSLGCMPRVGSCSDPRWVPRSRTREV